MFRYIVIVLALIAGLGDRANAQTPNVSGKVLILRQSVTGPDNGTVSSSNGRISNALPTQRTITLDVGGAPIVNPESVGSLPVRDYGQTLTTTQIEIQFRSIVNASLPGLVTALRNYMSTNGITVTFFDFVQTIRIAGVAIKRSCRGFTDLSR